MRRISSCEFDPERGFVVTRSGGGKEIIPLNDGDVVRGISEVRGHVAFPFNGEVARIDVPVVQVTAGDGGEKEFSTLQFDDKGGLSVVSYGDCSPVELRRMINLDVVEGGG